MADTMSPRDLRSSSNRNLQELRTQHVEQINMKNDEIEKLQQQIAAKAAEIEKVSSMGTGSGVDYVIGVVGYTIINNVFTIKKVSTML